MLSFDRLSQRKIKNKKKDLGKNEISETEVANQISVTSNLGLTQEEIQLFRDFLVKSSNGMDYSFHSHFFYDNWIIDIRASQHMFRNLQIFTQTLSKELNHYVTIPSGKVLQVEGVGSITLSENLILRNVFLCS